MNSMLIGCAFGRLLASVVRCTESFVDFEFFTAILYLLGNQGHPKQSPQKVTNKGGLWIGRFWPIPVNSPHTSWKLPPPAKTMQQWCQFQQPVRLLISMARSVYSVMVAISSRLNLNYLKVCSPSNVSIKRVGSVPKNSLPSQHSRQSKTCKTEQQFFFISSV